MEDSAGLRVKSRLDPCPMTPVQSLAVLIVPYNEHEFFPTRPKSVHNMANFKLAERYFTVLPISVPTWIIGLLPENEK